MVSVGVKEKSKGKNSDPKDQEWLASQIPKSHSPGFPSAQALCKCGFWEAFSNGLSTILVESVSVEVRCCR